jgi:hypothetical protein
MLDVDDLGSWALTPYRRVRPVRRVPTDPAALAAIASYVAGGETYAAASRHFDLGYDQIRAICRAAGVRSDQAQRTGRLGEAVRRRIASALLDGAHAPLLPRATPVLQAKSLLTARLVSHRNLKLQQLFRAHFAKVPPVPLAAPKDGCLAQLCHQLLCLPPMAAQAWPLCRPAPAHRQRLDPCGRLL